MTRGSASTDPSKPWRSRAIRAKTPSISRARTSGDENVAQFGFSVATAGDVNGDGYADVVVGARGHDSGSVVNSDRGRAYVYLGSASGLATSPAWTGSGDENGAEFGYSVATAGDVNGGGYAGVGVGARHHNAGAGLNAYRGRAYAYLGSASGLATRKTLHSACGKTTVPWSRPSVTTSS